MPQDHPIRPFDAPDPETEETPAPAKLSVEEWWQQAKQDPSLFWSSPTVRAILWLVLGLIAMLIVYLFTHLFSSAPRTAAAPPAPPTATLYVACTNSYCLKSYVIERPMDYKDWPAPCDYCAQRSVYRARLCQQCGQWYATAPAKPKDCPFCKLKEAELLDQRGAEKTEKRIDGSKAP